MSRRPAAIFAAKRKAWLRAVLKGHAEAPTAMNQLRFDGRALGWAEPVMEREGVLRPYCEVRAGYPTFLAMLRDGWKVTAAQVLTTAGQRIMQEGGHG